MVSKATLPRFLPRPVRLALLPVLAAAALPCAAAAAEGNEVTLPVEQVVPVDLKSQQEAAERAAALERARVVAAMPGAKEREALVPEMMLLQRQVLTELPVVATRPDGPRQTWYVRGSAPPVLYAQRVIPRLLRAGFSSAPGCAGEEWSGTHGGNRVAVRAEERTVAIVLVRGNAACPDGSAPRPL